MRVDEYIEVLRADGEGLAAAAQRGGLDAVVPTCPGWQIRDLLQHLGGVQRWATAHVSSQRGEPFSKAEEQRFFRLEPDETLIDWFRTGHRRLVSALQAAEPTLQAWTFLPARTPLLFWARRQAHEAAVHRADAEAASGGDMPEWEPEFAVDGMDELLEAILGGRRKRLAADPPVSITLSATDIDATRTVRMGPAGLRVVDGGSPATLTLAGTAANLYLLVWNRIGIEPFEVRGDPRALETWRRTAVVIRE